MTSPVAPIHDPREPPPAAPLRPSREEGVGAFLDEQAARAPSQTAILEHGRRGRPAASYAELAEDCRRIAAGFARAGLRRGDRVCVFVPPGRTWLASVYALLRLGAVPVAIDPGMGRRALLGCIERSAPRGLVAVPRALALRFAAPRAFRTVEVAVCARAPRIWPGPTVESMLARPAETLAPAAISAGDPAAILFTSGATGPPKGVVYTHGMFAAQVEALKALYGFRPGETDVACFPLFALLAPALGWTAVVPRLDFSRPGSCDPGHVAEAIQESGATNTFGSPAIWRRVAPWCAERGIVFGSLERLAIAGAPVEPELVEQCARLLPRGEVHTPYGATEALPVSSVPGRDLLGRFRPRFEAGEGNCAGRPAPGIEIRLIRIQDERVARWSDDLEVAPGEVGEVCVRGALVTREYLLEAEATAGAKIEAEGGAPWHRMGDLGRLDGEGNLWLLGRKAHRIETAKGLVTPLGIENVLRRHERVERCALVGVGPRGRERPYLVAVIKPGLLPARERERRDLERDILRTALWHPVCGCVEGVLYRGELPVDVRHNAKIDRLALKRWAEERAR